MNSLFASLTFIDCSKGHSQLFSHIEQFNAICFVWFPSPQQICRLDPWSTSNNPYKPKPTTVHHQPRTMKRIMITHHSPRLVPMANDLTWHLTNLKPRPSQDPTKTSPRLKHLKQILNTYLTIWKTCNGNHHTSSVSQQNIAPPHGVSASSSRRRSSSSRRCLSNSAAWRLKARGLTKQL